MEWNFIKLKKLTTKISGQVFLPTITTTSLIISDVNKKLYYLIQLNKK